MKEPRLKFTTTLTQDTINTLAKLAPIYNKRNYNDIIEILVQKDWEEKCNEVETQRGNK